jgi:4-hydroxymandelate oxidase
VLDLAVLEEAARDLLPPAVADYYAGGAEGETTLQEANPAWRAWRLRPRVLRGGGAVSVATSLLGSDVATPVGVAPWAYHALAHPDGECGTARGAAAAGALLTVSTSASTSLSHVAAVEPAAPKWFQLYRLHSPAHTDDLARRAGDAGYRALVLTVDLPVLGRRLRDLAHDFVLPAELPLPNHPLGGVPPAAVLPPWTFDDIGRFGELSGLPVVVKGVLRADDALTCVDAGAAGIIVSTHGGRCLTQSTTSADALPEVAEAVGDRAEVYVDSGLRTPEHVAAALCLGARAVFLGRPVLWALATGGDERVEQLLAGFDTQLERVLRSLGVGSLDDLGPDLVV